MTDENSVFTAAIKQDEPAGPRHGVAPHEPTTLCGIEREQIMLLRGYLRLDAEGSCSACVAEACRRIDA